MRLHRMSLPFSAFIVLATWACGPPPVPKPSGPETTEPTEAQLAECKRRGDPSLGCAACAGLSYCGWRQTTSPLDGTCEYVKKPSSDATLVSDPQNCPKPPQ